MTTTERSYTVIQVYGSFGVEISPGDTAPLSIFGFISEAEALAWTDAEQNRTTEHLASEPTIPVRPVNPFDDFPY